jgi:SAM-dependent methyltransferase
MPPLVVLDRIVAEAPDRADPPEDQRRPLQEITHDLAFEPGSWTRERAGRVRELFDGLAGEWHTRGGEERAQPIRDGLCRGGIPTGGTCLELGSGTGLWTSVVASHFARTVSTDFAPEMLGRSPRAESSLVLSDATRLPFRDGSFDAAVCVNMFLFPAECRRVLGPNGSLLFVSTNGARTPIYLSPADVVAAMGTGFVGTSSEACWGTWTVATRRGGEG